MTLYDELLAAARKAAIWVDALVMDARVDYSRYYKEVYVVLGDGREVLAIKLVERRWYTTPKLLMRYAVGLLRRAKERGRRAALLLIVPRLSGGALDLLTRRLRWIKVLPLSFVMNVKIVAFWVREKVLEAFGVRVYAKHHRLLAEKLGEAMQDAIGKMTAGSRSTGPPLRLV